ncbi:MAG: exopolysaccharide biosynthesis protein, partial [Alphaproteobacteria bacterium]
MHNKTIKISELLANFTENNYKDEISIAEIINILSDRSFGLLMIFFALPGLIPIPGISTLAGIPLIFFSLQLILAFNKPWLPKLITQKKIKFENLTRVINKALPYFIKIEFFLKERGALTHGKLGERLVGIFALAFSITLTLPILFGNALPC